MDFLKITRVCVSFTGCEPIQSTSKWGLPIQGRRLPLADLIRFPAESLKHDRSLYRRFASPTPCDALGRHSKLVFDFEAFQVDRYGSLVFTRLLGDQEIHDFCVDQITVQRPEGTPTTHHFMAAVFCQPPNVTEVDESLQLLNLPNHSRGNNSGLKERLTFMFILFVNGRAML